MTMWFPRGGPMQRYQFAIVEWLWKSRASALTSQPSPKG